MQQPLEIAFVSSEMRPFFQVSEVAAYVDALAKETALRGHQAVVFLPGGERWRKFPGLRIGHAIGFDVEGFGPARVRMLTLEGSPTRIVAVDGEVIDGKPADQLARDPRAAVFFSKAVLAALPRLGWRPHVFHIQDGLGAPISLLLREDYSLSDEMRETRTVFGLHEPTDLCIFETSPVDLLGEVGAIEDVKSALRMGNEFSFVRAALVTSDRVTVAGRRYAEQLQQDGKGFGLESILAQAHGRIDPIMWGIDTSRWNPLGDELLPFRFGPNDHVQRGNDKIRLLESLHLPIEPDVPLVTMDGDLVADDGWELLSGVVGDLLGERLKLALFGRSVSDVQAWDSWAKGLAAKAPDQVAYVKDASEPQFRLQLAGADFVLLAARHEPTAQFALRSMHYGTVPICHHTGALLDAVNPYQLETAKGEGFVFKGYNGGDLLSAVRRGLEVYEHKSAWKKLVSRLQQIDVSWARTGGQAMASYERALSSPKA